MDDNEKIYVITEREKIHKIIKFCSDNLTSIDKDKCDEYKDGYVDANLKVLVFINDLL